MKIAINTVFILKENILFLEEWILYHLLLGFNKFYLYDNSKVQKSTGCHPKSSHFKIGKVNKYGVNYDEIVDMTDTQMNDYVKKLCEKYKCIEIIEWSPTDDEGTILYDQTQARNECLIRMKKDKIDWCANIDMDEYIVIKKFDDIEKYILSLPKNVCNIKMGQIRFKNRFSNLGGLVTDISDANVHQVPINHSNKNIFRVDNTKSVTVHAVSLKKTDKLSDVKEYHPPINEVCFNHYNMGNHVADVENNIVNINQNIKDKLKQEEFLPLK